MLTSFFVLACQHGSHVSSARPLLLRIQVVQSGPGASQAPVICRKSLAILSWFRIAPRPSHEVSKNFIFIFKNLINILYYFFKIVCFRHCFPHTVYVNWKRLLQHCVTLSDWYVYLFPVSLQVKLSPAVSFQFYSRFSSYLQTRYEKIKDWLQKVFKSYIWISFKSINFLYYTCFEYFQNTQNKYTILYLA